MPDSRPPSPRSTSSIQALESLAPIERLLAVMARLRDPDGGCPWDLEQSYATIAPYTIEEAYEVADAIERGDLSDLKDELGDLLLQVVFHAQMAAEENAFDFAAVAEAVAEKMIRRHPHVFGTADAEAAETVMVNWETIKAAERAAKAQDGSVSALDGVARGLPALLRAVKLQKRAARVSFDWGAVAPVIAKIEEELEELKVEMAREQPHPERLQDELGDLLFAVVNLARHLKIDPEAALRHTNNKFERRFRALEAELTAGGADLAQAGLEAMEAAWQRAKAAETKKQDEEAS
ncbi:nucleoside triphosphate pyrophosphohydrolase [Algihabitans albus]|uniref:nucleoside triphosphate pyrophosphohydrolase n=1 Tax=Algihabitans albus TaxID=2164067 RepID=UPI001ABCD76F|nr:nucleoside triphosphate pyrophosphohydrolase [Algihabitans albus]